MEQNPQPPQNKEFVTIPPVSPEEAELRARINATEEAVRNLADSLSDRIPPQEAVPSVVIPNDAPPKAFSATATAGEAFRMHAVGAEIQLPPRNDGPTSFDVDAMMPPEPGEKPFVQPTPGNNAPAMPDNIDTEIPPAPTTPPEEVSAHDGDTVFQPTLSPADILLAKENFADSGMPEAPREATPRASGVSSLLGSEIFSGHDVQKEASANDTGTGTGGNSPTTAKPPQAQEVVSPATPQQPSTVAKEPITVTTAPDRQPEAKGLFGKLKKKATGFLARLVGVDKKQAGVVEKINAIEEEMLGGVDAQGNKILGVKQTQEFAKNMRPGPDTNATTIKVAPPVAPEAHSVTTDTNPNPKPSEISDADRETGMEGVRNVTYREGEHFADPVKKPKSPEEIEEIRKKIEAAEKGISAVKHKTEERERGLLERIGDGLRKNIFTRASEKIAEKFNTLPPAVRYGAGLSIVAVGSLGIPFAAPVLTLAAAGYKVISGVVLYDTLHTQLEKQYVRLEKDGKEISASRKLIMEAGAIGVSAFLGYALGQLISSLTEGMSSSPVPPTASADLPASSPAVPAPETTSVIETAATQATEALPEAPPSMTHTVLPNERLWDIVKDHLFQNDTFKNLTLEAKNLEISKYIAYIAQEKMVSDVNSLQVGQVIDFSKIDGSVPADILKHVNPFAK